MKAERLKLYRSIVIIEISICMILLLFIPVYAYWIPEAYEDGQVAGWNDVVICEDELYQLILQPFYIIFPIVLVVKKKWIKLILKLLLFLDGLALFFIGMTSGVLAQDYSAGYGTLILLGVTLLLGIMYLLDWIIFQKKSNMDVENELKY